MWCKPFKQECILILKFSGSVKSTWGNQFLGLTILLKKKGRNFILLSAECPSLNDAACYPQGTNQFIIPPSNEKQRKKSTPQPFPGDHLPSISILETFSIGLISLGDLSVLIHFSIYNRIVLVSQLLSNQNREKEKQKGYFLSHWPACQPQTHDLTARWIMWCIDATHNSDNSDRQQDFWVDGGTLDEGPQLLSSDKWGVLL